MNDLTVPPGSGGPPDQGPPGNGRRTVYVEPVEREEEGFLTLEEVVGVLRRSWWMIVLGGVLSLGGTIWLLSTETQLHQASALIRLTDARGALAGGMMTPQQPATVAGADPVLSEVMVLRGRGVLGTVVDREGLRLLDPERGAAPAWVRDASVETAPDRSFAVEIRFGPEAWSARAGARSARAPYGEPASVEGVTLTVAARPEAESARLRVVPRDLAIDLLSGGLVASPRKGTDGIDVSYTSPDPEAAERIVNTVVQVYQEVNARTAQQQATRRRMFLEKQLQETDSLLIEAQAALSAFRSGQQVYSSRERLAAQQSAMLELEMREEELDADRRTYRALLDALEAGRSAGEEGDLAALVSAPGIASNPVVSQLYGQLVSYQSARDSATTGPWARAPTHPDVERLDQLIASTEERLIEAARSHVASLDARLAQLGGLRSRNAQEMGRLPDAEAREVRLVQQVETMRAVGDQLRAEYQKARVEEAVEAGEVEIVNLATRAIPVPRREGLKLFLGLMIGVMLGTGAGFLRDHLDDALVRNEEVEKTLRVPSLAIVPRIVATNGRSRGVGALIPGATGGDKNGKKNGRRTRRRGAGGGSPVLDGSADRPALHLHAPGTEAYRTLRTNLIFSRASGGLTSLVVSSAGPEEGKTITAANLGLAFAQQGVRVLLVDSDLRRPDLAKTFGLPRAPGLTDVLLGDVEIKQAVRQTGVTGLHVLPSGKRPPNPSELLGGQRMEQLVESMANRYDLLILDSPPLLAAPDAAVLGAMADGVLVVVRAGTTERDAAAHARQQLERVGARVVGFVLNDPDAKVPRYGSYYAYRYYEEMAET